MSRCSPKAKDFGEYSESIAEAMQDILDAMQAGDCGHVGACFMELDDLLQDEMFDDWLDQGGLDKARIDLANSGTRLIIEDGGIDGAIYVRVECWSGTGPNIIALLLLRDKRMKLQHTDLAELALWLIHEKKDYLGLDGKTLLYGIAHDDGLCAVSMDRV